MRRAALAVLGLALAGCAQPSALQPSYLGLSDAAASEDESDIKSALAGIPSNKVLGAMAFQKATGRSVDPGRLTGGR